MARRVGLSRCERRTCVSEPANANGRDRRSRDYLEASPTRPNAEVDAVGGRAGSVGRSWNRYDCRRSIQRAIAPRNGARTGLAFHEALPTTMDR